MSPRTEPPFRADHVGSLLRPQALLDARTLSADGEITPQQLRQAEDDAIRDVVAMQRDLGLQTATDGEFRRSSWHMDFLYQLGGVQRVADEHITVQFHSAEGDLQFTPAASRVTGKITLDHTIFGDHFTFLAEQVTDATPKLTIPSPSMLHYRGGRAAIDETVYPDMEEFWHDLSAAYAAEVRALADLGCRYLQFDDTSLAYLNDPQQRQLLAERGDDGEHQHLRNIRQVNAALAGRPESLRITVHMCRGNFQSSWVAEGGYDYVAEPLFGELDVDGFFLEYDDARSGGFEPLRFVPDGKIVVLGLVTTKSPKLEDPDVLKRRIDEASRYVPLERLCLSPQCGFSSTVEGNKLTIDEQKAKLALIRQVADDVWG